jgi:hypothetical protein
VADYQATPAELVRPFAADDWPALRLLEVYLERVLYGGLPAVEVRFGNGAHGTTVVAVSQALGGTRNNLSVTLATSVQLPAGLVGRAHPDDLARMIESWSDRVFRPWMDPNPNPIPYLTLWPRLARLRKRCRR